jgi:hypothetical protein
MLFTTIAKWFYSQGLGIVVVWEILLKNNGHDLEIGLKSTLFWEETRWLMRRK